MFESLALFLFATKALSGRGNQLQKFLLRMQTDWQKEDKTLSMSSAWPTKHEFDRPLVVSNLQVWPLEASVASPQPKPGEAPPPSSVKLQMQVYGNKLGMICTVLITVTITII